MEHVFDDSGVGFMPVLVWNEHDVNDVLSKENITVERYDYDDLIGRVYDELNSDEELNNIIRERIRKIVREWDKEEN